MEWFALFLGWVLSSVTMVLGYNLVPLALLALTVATVLVLRDRDND